MDYRQIFTPKTPISEADLLFGREKELSRLKECFETPGASPVILGERGIGKTSLVKAATEGCFASRVDCVPGASFDRLARATLKQLAIDIRVTETVKSREKEVKGLLKLASEIGATGKESRTTRTIELGQLQIDPHLLFEILSEIKEPNVVVFDKYDRLTKADDLLRTGMGSLVKMLSNNADKHRTTLVFIGIGTGAEILLGSHESIHRQVEEIFLKILPASAMRAFLHAAAEKSGIVFDEKVVEFISKGSDGLPYFTHFLALESIATARLRDPSARYVAPADFELAKERAASQVFRHYLKEYRDRIDALSSREKDVLRHINLSKQLDINRDRFRAYVVQKGQMTAAEVDAGLTSLFSKRLLFELKHRPGHFRYTDLLLKPFLRLLFGFPKATFPRSRGELPQPDLFPADEFGF